MNGIDYLIDTNILIYILQGNPKARYFSEEEYLSVSCITEMEVLGKYRISIPEKQIITGFLNRCHIIEIDAGIKQLAITIRQHSKVKLPDAIIAATAIKNNVLLVTSDKDFEKIPDLEFLLMDMS